MQDFKEPNIIFCTQLQFFQAATVWKHNTSLLLRLCCCEAHIGGVQSCSWSPTVQQSLAPGLIKHLNQLSKVSRITGNFHAGVYEINSVGSWTCRNMIVRNRPTAIKPAPLEHPLSLVVWGSRIHFNESVCLGDSFQLTNSKKLKS